MARIAMCPCLLPLLPLEGRFTHEVSVSNLLPSCPAKGNQALPKDPEAGLTM